MSESLNIPIDDFKKILTRKTDSDRILDAVEFAIFVIDCTGCIQYYNKNAFQNLFLSKKNIINQPVDEIINEQNILDIIQNVIFKEKLIKNAQVKLNNGNYHLINVFSLVKKKNIEGFVFITRDITSEHHLLLNELQKKSIDSLTKLTSTIAHEIKNPLAALDLHIQLIKRFAQKQSIEEKETKLMPWLHVLSDEIKRLNSIVDHFSSPLRKTKLQKRQYFINQLLEEVVQLFKPICKEKNIKLIIKLDNINELISIDVDQIKQVFINLLQNAIQSHNHPKYKPIIEIESNLKKDFIIIFIRDNGIGIKEEDRTNIFNPFFTTKIKGTGVGLTLSFKTIEAHNGKITFESKENKGTIFKIMLPRLTRKFIG